LAEAARAFIGDDETTAMAITIVKSVRTEFISAPDSLPEQGLRPSFKISMPPKKFQCSPKLEQKSSRLGAISFRSMQHPNF
jgi:hypothetical protein